MALPYSSTLLVLLAISASMVVSLGMLYALRLVQGEYRQSLMWRQLRHLTIANLVFGAAVWFHRSLGLLADIMSPPTGAHARYRTTTTIVPPIASNTERDLMCRCVIGVMDGTNTTMFMTEAHLGLAFAASIYQCPAIMGCLRRILRLVWPLGIMGALLNQWTAEIGWFDNVGCKIWFANGGNTGYVYIIIYSASIAICSICYLLSYARMSRSNFAVQSKVRHRARGFLLGWLVCESINYIRLLDGYGNKWKPEFAAIAIALKCLSPVANAVVYFREAGFLARITSHKRTNDLSSAPRPSRSFNVSIGEATIVEYDRSASTPRVTGKDMLACFDPVPEEDENDVDSVQFEQGF